MMWQRPWGLKEGLAVCIGLLCIGIALQLSIGGFVWSHLAWPINIYLLTLFIILEVILYTLHRRIYSIRWAMSYSAAIPALATAVVLTLIMGLTQQLPEGHRATDPLGLTRMLECWPLVLVYLWMTIILGLTTIKQFTSPSLRKIPVMCLHTGLFVVIVCATAGSADMQRMTMTTGIGRAEWRACDVNGNIVELPFAVELNDFSIDEYPPKIMAIDNATGEALPAGKPEHLMLNDGLTGGSIGDWTINVEQVLDYAAPLQAYADTTSYSEWHTAGATSAALISATSADGATTVKGWISCGSFAFPYRALRADSTLSFIMPDREPRRFASDVTIYTKSGKRVDATIEVNKPVTIEGRKIYQLSYDETKGRWSDVSVLEIVSDPWLPVVYVGLMLMLLGAILLLFTTRHQAADKSN